MGVPGGGGGGSREAVAIAAAAACLLLLQLCGCAAALPMKSGGGGGARYKDPSQPLNTRIDDLLRRMTLAEKIGQMSQIERENATADVIIKYFIGTYIVCACIHKYYK